LFRSQHVGLLVRTWGRVTEVEAAAPPAPPTWFTIDYDSRVGLKCALPAGVMVDPALDFVTVTGISSCETRDQFVRVVRVGSQDDILPLR
jgi:hypothetical protein